MFRWNSIYLTARYVALRQRDLYHIETERGEVISNFAKHNISNTRSVYIDKGEITMENNSIKSNYTIDEIHWTLYPQGNIKEWDGLSKSFIKLVDNNKELLKDNYIKAWYNISKKLLQ